jgi:hypothetical protein
MLDLVQNADGFAEFHDQVLAAAIASLADDSPEVVMFACWTVGKLGKEADDSPKTKAAYQRMSDLKYKQKDDKVAKPYGDAAEACGNPYPY